MINWSPLTTAEAYLAAAVSLSFWAAGTLLIVLAAAAITGEPRRVVGGVVAMAVAATLYLGGVRGFHRSPAPDWFVLGSLIAVSAFVTILALSTVSKCHPLLRRRRRAHAICIIAILAAITVAYASINQYSRVSEIALLAGAAGAVGFPTTIFIWRKDARKKREQERVEAARVEQELQEEAREKRLAYDRRVKNKETSVEVARERERGRTHTELIATQRSVLIHLYEKSGGVIGKAVPILDLLGDLGTGETWLAVQRLNSEGEVEVRQGSRDNWDESVSLTVRGVQSVHAIYDFAQHDSIRIERMWNVEGDQIFAGDGAVVINRSSLLNSLNRVREHQGDEVADALLRLGKTVELEGDDEAAELFDTFSAELQSDSPKKPVLRALFDGLQKAIPTISQMTDIATKLAPLIQ